MPDILSDSDWWRGAVIYQIYPRSYQDSNGDGIGDLQGIRQRLPYIAKLGVDAIWISPFFRSPMKDFGYDVSDYRDVDPMFGTLADFDQLIAEAHKLGIRIMIDLVLSHSSDQHPWFLESRANRDNPRSDWYVWADPKPDGTVPNNWLSIFGGSAWQWDARREQYYLHNFLTSQPDLNFHNSDVQDALLDITRFWLERGVDGFRLDTINFYVHDKELRDNPPLPPEQRNATIAPSVNPYNHQMHIYDRNRPENLLFLERFRTLLDQYDARTCVGEIGDAQAGLELLGAYTKGENRAHMCYAFELLSGARPSAERIAAVFARMDKAAAEGWACWAFSNHDVERHVSRWKLSDKATRLYLALLVCLRGTICLYQGEELGFAEAQLEYEDLQDPYGIEFWPEYKGRDGCRTPMAWSGQNASNGGFSEGKPWLPLDEAHLDRAVTRQEDSSDSMLAYYQKMIGIRKAHPALRKGSQAGIVVEGDALHFMREHKGQTYYCAFNLGEQSASLKLPAGNWETVLRDLGGEVTQNDEIKLGPWQAFIAEQKK